MKNNLYKILVVLALAVVMLSACSANGDWTTNGGKCDNGANCVYSALQSIAK